MGSGIDSDESEPHLVAGLNSSAGESLQDETVVGIRIGNEIRGSSRPRRSAQPRRISVPLTTPRGSIASKSSVL